MLGPVEVVRDGVAVPLGGPRQRGLLALFLLRPNQFVPADWLVDALWDGRPPASGATTLRTYIAGLRRAVDPRRSRRGASDVLIGHSQGYELRVTPESIDSVHFDQLVATATAALRAGDPVAAERGYTAALALWRGEPMAGVPDLAAVRPEARRLAEARVGAEEGRLAAGVAAGRHAALLAELGRFVAAHPLREGARAQLMLALYRSGRQTEALAVYERGRRVLAEEYGLEPGEQLRDTHRLVLTQSVPAATPAAGTESLVGRDAELARLAAELDAALRGSGRIATVVGEPGIGKTSLVTALAGRAAATGVPVVWGRCPDVGQAPPFWLWRQVVRQLRELPQAGAAGSAAALDGFADAPSAGRGTAELDPAARFHAYEAVAALVRAVAAARGLLVALDDLHAADPDSLLLLRFLAGALAGTRALVVATLRPYEHAPALVATAADLARAPGHTRLPVAGLDDGAVADLLRERAGGAPAGPVVTRLRERTGGNPFFLTELIRAGTDPAGPHLPPTVRDTVRPRLDALTAPARRCLDLLAVAGGELSVRTMAAALDLPEGEVAEALVVAYAAALVTEAGSGGTRFRHPLLAEAAYAALPPPRRQALHARLAAAYERLGGASPGPLAYHHGRAAPGSPEHLRWTLAAAEDATGRLAYEDALAHLDRAATLLAPRAATSPPDARAELSVQLHRASLLQMTVGVGSDAVDRVCARARQLLPLAGEGFDARPALWALGELAANRADFALCEELATRLATGPAEDPALVAAGEYLLGVVGYFTGRLAAAERHLTAAVDRLGAAGIGVLSRQVGRRPVLAAHDFRALVRSLRGDAAGARADLAAAERQAERLGDPYGRANAALYAGWRGLQEQDVAATRAAARRCREIGAQDGLPHFVTTGVFLAEWAAARGGDHRRLPAMRAAAEAIYQHGLGSTRTITLTAAAEAYLVAGEHGTAAELAARGLAVADEVGERVLAAELYRILGLARDDPAALATGARLAAEQGCALVLARFPHELHRTSTAG